MSDIVVHGFSFSPYTRSVAMTLEIKRIPYRTQWIDLRPVEGGLGSVEHRGLHPFARAPILEDDGFRIYETQAILRYLDAQYSQFPLQPTDPRAIGRMSQIMGILDCYMFEGAIKPVTRQRVVRPALAGAAPDEAEVAKALPATKLCLMELNRLLGENEFLAGDTLSLADIMLAPQLHLLSPAPEAREILEGTKLFDWLDRMVGLPSMIATAPPPEFKLPGRLRDLEPA